ncbi:glycosyltransferase involved in cell wall biosynthesis [Spirosoma lacussanchae]|uniref:glycosyltransferase n=1 Tax=Spirosoma lacussanchae TaxID=1884249 RepID=UPI001107F918|nr:glycosyltransferase [Spirosoma lacussanchae]
MKDGVSIIVCTYNGASRLAPTLLHIAKQKTPDTLKWEVILIDNKSTDNSASIAKELWNSYDCDVDFRIVHQPIQGLSFARDMGFQEARYEYILMCDDDNWLNDDYVETAYSIMNSYPTVGILGGHGNLVYETSPPDWVTNYPIHASGSQVYKFNLVRSYGIYGAGCVLRKSAYQTLKESGFEFTLTDRLGSELSSGGDIELCYAIALAGYAVYYDHRLQFQHFIPYKRTTWEYCIKYVNDSSLSHIVLEPFKILLIIKTQSLATFRLVLLINFILRVLHLAFYLTKRMALRCVGVDTKIIDLKVATLKAKLSTYKHHSVMVSNFRKLAAIQQQFSLNR